jgi:hypothetical protein
MSSIPGFEMNKLDIIIKIPHKLKKFFKKLIYPVIYSYPGYILYDFMHRLTGYKKERNRVCKVIGYYPDLKNPRSFNEKVLWKKFYDRNPLLPVISDKYRVRKYLREVLGQDEADNIMVPLLYVTDRPETIPFDTLEGEYIIKPNHASGFIILAENIEGQKRYTVMERSIKTLYYDSVQTRKEIIATCKRWLTIPYGYNLHEWAYQKIKRKIIIEKLLKDSSGKVPDDYKFFVFHGKCHSIFVLYDRFIEKCAARYTPDWEPINVQVIFRQAAFKEKPKNLQNMLNIAETFGKHFDFIRVDLYLSDNNIYFGEMTSYATSGTIIFNPISFDFELGAQWNIVHKYWKYL